jgi:hypothetical protein
MRADTHAADEDRLRVFDGDDARRIWERIEAQSA